MHIIVKSRSFFEVRTEFFNIIWTSFGFKGFVILSSLFPLLLSIDDSAFINIIL
jgi:hypothetical protein